MNLLTKLESCSLELQPLARHYLATADQHTREHYALLLCAVIQTQHGINAEQSRLLSLLLESMNLIADVGQYLQWASKIEVSQLKEALQICKADTNYAASLLMDASMLIRVTGRLDKEQQHLLSTVVNLLEINAEKIGHVVKYVQLALGLDFDVESLNTLIQTRHFRLESLTKKIKLNLNANQNVSATISDVNTKNIKVVSIFSSNQNKGVLNFQFNVKGTYKLKNFYAQNQHKFNRTIQHEIDCGDCYLIFHIQAGELVENKTVLARFIPLPSYIWHWQEFILDGLTQLYPIQPESVSK